MTNSQNLESFIARHEALKAENERLQTENLALKKQVHCQYVAFCEGYNDRPTEPCTNCIVPAQAPAAEVIAPKPEYQVGDKVLFIHDVSNPRECFEVAAVTLLSGEYRYSLRSESGAIGSYPRFENELIPSDESCYNHS